MVNGLTQWLHYFLKTKDPLLLFLPILQKFLFVCLFLHLLNQSVKGLKVASVTHTK